MIILKLIQNFDDYMKDPKKILQFFRKNIAAFVLAIVVFILLYINIAETGRRKMLQHELKRASKNVFRLEKEVIQTKKDFYHLSKQIQENDSIFYNSNFDVYVDVNTIIKRMSNRFEADGISFVPDDRTR